MRDVKQIFSGIQTHFLEFVGINNGRIGLSDSSDSFANIRPRESDESGGRFKSLRDSPDSYFFSVIRSLRITDKLGESGQILRINIRNIRANRANIDLYICNIFPIR